MSWREDCVSVVFEGVQKLKNILWLLLQVLGDLRADNQRLKDENAALIRVISKLSRWTHTEMKWKYYILLLPKSEDTNEEGKQQHQTPAQHSQQYL